MNAGSRLRALGALGITVSMLAAACQAGTGTPSPSAAGTPGASTGGPSPTPAPPTVPTPGETPIPSTSPTVASPEPGSPWVPASSLADFPAQTAVPLGDGGALVISDDGLMAQRWVSATKTWHEAMPLNAPRTQYAAVPLRDGRVLVTGGLDTHDRNRWQAYSSTYVYDPSTRAGSWTKVGLLGTARVAPAAAVLPDGCVLVAGGAYKDGPPYDYTGWTGITLASSTSSVRGPGTGGGSRFDDVAPPSIGVALATAELFDPTTGQWTPTGPMRFARAGAVAVTLSDGRVLVVGSSGAAPAVADVDARAHDTSEVYDPATGRFSLAGSLPSIDRAEVVPAGVDLPDEFYRALDSPFGGCFPGALVAVPDGGAVLLGLRCETRFYGTVTRDFRFDAWDKRWRQLGRTTGDLGAGPESELWWALPGLDTGDATAAALPDGRVLVAGGSVIDEFRYSHETRLARTYDAIADNWEPLPSMPAMPFARVVLADGSILFLCTDVEGGTGTEPEIVAVRFVATP